jgi:hypothetical protein
MEIRDINPFLQRLRPAHRPVSHPAPRRRLVAIGCFPVSCKLNPLSLLFCRRSPQHSRPASSLRSTKKAQMPSIKQIQASRANGVLFKGPSHARGNKSLPSNSVRLFLGLPPAKCFSTQRSLTPTSAEHAACSYISATRSRRMLCTVVTVEQQSQKIAIRLDPRKRLKRKNQKFPNRAHAQANRHTRASSLTENLSPPRRSARSSGHASSAASQRRIVINPSSRLRSAERGH